MGLGARDQHSRSPCLIGELHFRAFEMTAATMRATGATLIPARAWEHLTGIIPRSFQVIGLQSPPMLASPSKTEVQ
jgi:hypothetical protein